MSESKCGCFVDVAYGWYTCTCDVLRSYMCLPKVYMQYRQTVIKVYR